jgi:hypothetical protein
MKLHYSTQPRRNTARLAPLLCVQEKHTTVVRATFARYGRQNRSFEGITTEKEKRQDWMAARVGFELMVEFA